MPLTSTCTLLHLLQCHILGLSSSSGYVYVRSLSTCTSLLLNGTPLTWSEVKGKEGGADHTQTLGSAPLHNMLQLNTTFLLISVLTCTCVFFTAQAHVHIHPLTTAHAHPQTHGNGVTYIMYIHNRMYTYHCTAPVSHAEHEHGRSKWSSWSGFRRTSFCDVFPHCACAELRAFLCTIRAATPSGTLHVI